jgi:2-dehydro-3-deoxygalactonokinase
MKNFLSCDWGSTSFRLRLVDAAAWQHSTIEAKDKGIVNVFQLWKQSGTGEQGRFDFYLQVIGRHIRMLESQTGHSLKNLPLVISGMASSSLGMMEMEYKKIPVFADGRDLEVKKIAGTKDVMNDLYIISGARTDDDAMRGEETQLAGCEPGLNDERVFVFPGTHSKHVTVSKGMVTGIKSFMTGEFFELLGEKST